MSSNIRQNILKNLVLISSEGLQLSYQKSMPHITMYSELLGLWDLEYFPEDINFKKSFHKKEKEALASFHKIFEDISELPDYHTPHIEDLVKTDSWKRFSEAASKALKAFSKKEKELAKRALLAEYVKESSLNF